MRNSKDSINNRSVKTFGTLVHETEMAILVRVETENRGERDVWFPKSKLTSPSERVKNKPWKCILHLPAWIVESKNVIYLEEDDGFDEER